MAIMETRHGMAIQFEKPGIVELLLKGGANVNAGNIHNSMLFH